MHAQMSLDGKRLDDVNAAATVNTQPLYRFNVASQAQSDGCGTTWCSIA